MHGKVRYFGEVRNSLLVNVVQNLSVNICNNYCKKVYWHVFMYHSVDQRHAATDHIQIVPSHKSLTYSR